MICIMKSRVYKIATFKTSNGFSIPITKTCLRRCLNISYYSMWFVSAIQAAIQNWVNSSSIWLCLWIWSFQCGHVWRKHLWRLRMWRDWGGGCLMESYCIFSFIYLANIYSGPGTKSMVVSRHSLHTHTHTHTGENTLICTHTCSAHTQK